MIMNVFRTIEPISWMLGPKWETKQRSKQGPQCRIQPPPTGPSRGSRHWPIHSVSIIACPMLGNPRKFWILDSTPWIPDSRYWIPVFFNGTWILAPIVGGIPDSLSCTPNPHAKISQITESGFPYTGRKKFWGDKQRALWFVMVFSGVVIFSFSRSALVLARWWARVLADVFEKNENKNKTTSVYWLLRAWSLSSSCPLALELITGKILRIFLSVCNYYKSQMWT